jgi:hypothetical protein
MNIQKFKKPISLLLLFALVTISAFSLSGCGQKKDNGQITKDPIKVTGQKYSESKETTEEVEYPAQVLAQQEAKIIAKTAGTASDIKFKIGDKIQYNH